MRVKRGNVLRKRHKKILKLAKGFIGARSRIFKVANTKSSNINTETDATEKETCVVCGLSESTLL